MPKECFSQLKLESAVNSPSVPLALVNNCPPHEDVYFGGRLPSGLTRQATKSSVVRAARMHNHSHFSHFWDICFNLVSAK